ncbi:MAG: DUF438 domain-containing protein, partial [Desulfobacterales bacterium]
MNRTGEANTIDPRGLEHHEKEELIFPSIEELLKGESLKIVMEFNPLPLIYLLKTHGEFELSYEKEGPEEWILVVKRIAVDKNKREKLKEMVQNLKTGIMSEATKNQVKRLFQAADVKGMKDMEQDMKKQGFLHDAIRKNLCDIHLEVLREKLVDQQIEV